MDNKHPWEIDVAVLMIFFVRDDCFEKSFAAVKAARPRQLLLWQDGPRGEKDMEGIERCRKIAENIDWDCEVHRCYNEKNFGCDPSTFYSHKWAFSIVNKCIVIEDDVCPNKSFFRFCCELLDKYENDTRIYRICGMNQVKDFECPDSYFFSSIGSVWGWATWKRVADSWEENYDFLDDEYTVKAYTALKNTDEDDKYLARSRKQKAEGIPYWESVQTFSRHLNGQLNVIPSKNLVKNIGLGEKSTHSNIDLSMIPPEVREACYCDSVEMEFPLKHPKYIFENVIYKQRLYKILGKGHPFISFKRRLSGLFLRIKHDGFKTIVLGIKRRLNRRKRG